MSRYIAVEWLEENAKEYSLGYYDYDEYAVPLSALDEAPTITTKEIKYFDDDEHVWKIGRVIVDEMLGL